MKPVLVLQHLDSDGPGVPGRPGCARAGVSVRGARHRRPGRTFPERIDGHGALAVLGGEMSANDALPSLRDAEALIRRGDGGRTCR